MEGKIKEGYFVDRSNNLLRSAEVCETGTLNLKIYEL